MGAAEMNCRSLVLYLSAIVFSGTIAGCELGAVNDSLIKTEPAAPMYFSAKGKENERLNDPVREIQFNFVKLIRDQLEENGQVVKDEKLKDLEEVEKLSFLIALVDNSPTNKQVRNSVISAGVYSSTQNCGIYLQSLRGGQVTNRLGTDLLSAGLASASSLIKPRSTAQLLAALSGYSISVGSSIDRNVFAQQGAELIADAIMQLREESRASLEQKFSLSYSEWPIGLALADLALFQHDCSMTRGFSRIEEIVSSREAAIQALRNAAAAVYNNNGSPEQIMAIFQAYGPDTSYEKFISVPSSESGNVNWSEDLEQMVSTSWDCIESTRKQLTADADEKGENDSNAAESLAGAQDGATSEETDEQSTESTGGDEANQTTPPPASGNKYSTATTFKVEECSPAQGFEQTVRQMAVDAYRESGLEDASKDQIDATYRDVARSFQGKSDEFIQRQTLRREFLAQTLDGISAGEPALVVDLIVSASGVSSDEFSTNPKKIDPVFLYAWSAAESAKRLDGTTAEQTAIMALGAAKAALQAYSVREEDPANQQ